MLQVNNYHVTKLPQDYFFYKVCNIGSYLACLPLLVDLAETGPLTQLHVGVHLQHAVYDKNPRNKGKNISSFLFKQGSTRKFKKRWVPRGSVCASLLWGRPGFGSPWRLRSLSRQLWRWGDGPRRMIMKDEWCMNNIHWIYMYLLRKNKCKRRGIRSPNLLFKINLYSMIQLHETWELSNTEGHTYI